jgi:hypothetical protein
VARARRRSRRCLAMGLAVTLESTSSQTRYVNEFTALGVVR